MIRLKRFLASRLIRFSYGRTDRKRDTGQKTPADILRFDNILYGDDKRLKKWQLLDVYRPAGTDISKDKLPVIISVHGGSWVYGDKERYQFYCMRLAQHGFAVVNFSYRLAPESRFPSSVQDTEKIFQFVADNAAQYGFDTENVFAVGDSAGGHLLSMYIAALTNDEYRKNFPFIKTDKKLTLRGIALNCGKYNLNDDDKRIKLLLGGYMPQGGTSQELQILNSASQVTEAFPPTFLMSCPGDFLRNEADLMKAALDKAKVRNEFHSYGTEEKPLWHVFHLNPKLEEAVHCNDDECSFFKSLIK